MYEEIITKLKNFPEFRERRFRTPYLSKLALRSCGLEQKYETNDGHSYLLDLQELAEFAVSYESYNRIWRLVLKNEPSLRGQDYGEEDLSKQILEENKMLALRYEPNYYKDNKTLKEI